MQKADVLLIRAFSQTKQSCALDMSARMVVWNHSLFKIVSFFFLFIYLIFFFFNSTTNFLINWIACQMGRERGRILSLESPWPEQRSDNLINNTCPDKRCVQGLLLPFKCFASSRSNKNQVMCKAPSSGRLEGCTMLPLRSRWKSRFILHEQERRKAKCKNLYCNSKEKKNKIKKIIITRTRNVELQLLFVTGLGRREMGVGGQTGEVGGSEKLQTTT